MAALCIRQSRVTISFKRNEKWLLYKQHNVFYVLLRPENCAEVLSEPSTCWLALMTHFLEGRVEKRGMKKNV